MDKKEEAPGDCTPEAENIPNRSNAADSNKIPSIYNCVKIIIVRYGWCVPVLAYSLLNRLKLREA